MKATVTLALCLLVFFTFSTKPFPAASADGSRIISTKPQNRHFHKITTLRESDEVLDVAGDPLRPGVKYYIVSAIWGAGGGGVSLPSAETVCPRPVIQEFSDLNRGKPVTFSTLSGEDVIVEDASVTIKFNVTATDCDDGSTVWKADALDNETGNVLVTTGGAESQRTSIFSIQKYASIAYKLVSYNGESVGRYFDSQNNQQQLALVNDAAFMVVFMKADKYQHAKY